MWTLSTEYYIGLSVFREDSFYVLPPNEDVPYKTHLFHLCPKPSRYSTPDSLAGCIFTNPRIENVECCKCHQSPGDNIITVHTLLREA